jgi:hypothetical protein
LAAGHILLQNADAKFRQAGVRALKKVNLGGVEFARESIFHDEKLDFLPRGEWDCNPEIVAVLAGVIEQILSVKWALNEAVAVFDPLHNTARTLAVEANDAIRVAAFNAFYQSTGMRFSDVLIQRLALQTGFPIRANLGQAVDEETELHVFAAALDKVVTEHTH